MWIGMASGRCRTFDICVLHDARVWWEGEEGEGEGFSGKRVGFWMMWFFGVGHSYRQLEDLMYMWHLMDGA